MFGFIVKRRYNIIDYVAFSLVVIAFRDTYYFTGILILVICAFISSFLEAVYERRHNGN